MFTGLARLFRAFRHNPPPRTARRQRLLVEYTDPRMREPRYNIAPSQDMLAVRAGAETGKPEVAWLKWGLIPSWADDPKVGYKLINARAETVAVKPSFRSAFKKRRCLIVVDGWFEWQKTGGKTKQPYWLHRRDGRTFCLAGLWESWKRDDQAVESCAIITTAANEATRPVHERMPLVLAPEQYSAWLDHGGDPLEFLKPSPAEWWTATPVSTAVNNPRNDSPECIAPLA